MMEVDGMGMWSGSTATKTIITMQGGQRPVEDISNCRVDGTREMAAKVQGGNPLTGEKVCGRMSSWRSMLREIEFGNGTRQTI
ncbi:MAG: hypothetical protein Ct9H300mP11_30340 [Chloroflexota bacterium]|nr:MAG: hypothetical protein Ct9H300mP11_30340 [Chloroflexota bacterium]